MIEIEHIAGYTIAVVEDEDRLSLFNTLSISVVDKTKSVNERARSTRVLSKYIDKAIREQTGFLVTINGKILGACITEDRNKNKIIFINMISGNPFHTGILFHFILNTMFEDEPVYLHSPTSKFKASAEHVEGNLYKIKDNIAKGLQTLLGDSNG